MDKIQFKRSTRDVGGSIMIAIPREILDYLEVKTGTELTIMPEFGKHGKFISIWRKDEEDN